MALDIIVGRNGNQPFPISSDHAAVSGEHVRINIDDYNRWHLQDLNSMNGVFVQNDNGDFEQVFQKDIAHDTIIRLGGGGHRCYTFMARRVIQQPDDFSPQFQWLTIKREQLRAEEAEIEKKVKLASTCQSFSGLGALVLVFATMPLFKGDSSGAMTVRLLFMSVAPLIPKLIFGNPNEKLKAIREKKQKLLRCPKCGKPLSDHEIDQMLCMSCKAK